MAAKKLHLDVITPFEKVFSGEIDAIMAPGHEGYFGVLPGHAPMMMQLSIGEMKLKVDNKDYLYATSGGFAEILPDKITILAEAAESADKIDIERATRARERAEQRLARKSEDIDLDRARMALARALNRLKVASRR